MPHALCVRASTDTDTDTFADRVRSATSSISPSRRAPSPECRRSMTNPRGITASRGLGSAGHSLGSLRRCCPGQVWAFEHVWRLRFSLPGSGQSTGRFGQSRPSTIYGWVLVLLTRLVKWSNFLPCSCLASAISQAAAADLDLDLDLDFVSAAAAAAAAAVLWNVLPVLPFRLLIERIGTLRKNRGQAVQVFWQWDSVFNETLNKEVECHWPQVLA
ncbi:predicted protein [Histoplasma capsulatum G186AR]|uniref:Uncharacterized protein n=1 Tax=Ajellomyces capsulatus (strain G186AR / H82 / ATCC MYA-2454 / RMSCC 2432) TaxID=447093 RepID=C0NF58_AJECG|nr:uncharacterized protein HCBG_01524 [Histoplasma capsulatum G186AR]EEH09879.1 predicted protein [Histoplasma capsulatum G186AR]